MAAKPKANLGKMPCPDCGQPVAVMKAETGTLSYKCQEADCEATGFAPAHTAAARRWLSKLPQEPKPAAGKPAPAKTENEPPEDKNPAKSAFSLGGL